MDPELAGKFARRIASTIQLYELCDFGRADASIHLITPRIYLVRLRKY
jgi:hypothetical protein